MDFQKLSEYFSLIPLKGKRPLEKSWQQWCEKKRPLDVENFKGKNAGIACGPASGVIVVDVDDLLKFNAIIKENNWELPQTRVHITGSGKPHYLYVYPNNGKRYGCRSFKDPANEIDPETKKIKTIFDIKGLGGQVVAPGSIHPDTGKPYTVRHDIPPAPAPEWLLKLALHEESKEPLSQTSDKPADLSSLPVPLGTKKLIKDGEQRGARSEAIMSVLSSLGRANVPDSAIFSLFENYPIGEKYHEKKDARRKWLQDQINKVKRQHDNAGHAQGLSFDELEDEFSGDIEWLWRQHIPAALPSLISGREGSGKTSLCLQIAKETLESHSHGLVLWLATEGFVLDTVNKMRTHGLTDNRFQIIRKSDRTFRFNLFQVRDLKEIDSYLSTLQEPILAVFVDSLSGAIAGDFTEAKTAVAMNNLHSIVCDKFKAACVWIHHQKKGHAENLLDKSAGSPQITAAVRMVLSIVTKSAYVRTLKQAKTNLAPVPELTIIKAGNEIKIIEQEQSEENQTDKAEGFLLELFNENHKIPAREIYELGEEVGISSYPLKKAKARLGIQALKSGVENAWFWAWNL